MTPPIIYRQGDVLIERVESIPDTERRIRRKGKIILALGEATGHHHRIEKGKVTAYSNPKSPEVSYLDIANAVALLEHEEHETIALPPGKYRIGRQREYSPQEIRRVQD